MVAAGVLLVAILAALIVPYRAEERAIVHDIIIHEDAAVLYPEALQQIAESEAAASGLSSDPAELLVPVALNSMKQEGIMLAVAVFDPEGDLVQPVPSTMLLAELPPGDYPRLLGGEQISTYTPNFQLGRYFSGLTGTMPVLQVELPLHGKDPTKILGFVQYYLLAQTLAEKLAKVDASMKWDTIKTLALGAGLIAIVLAAAFGFLRRAQRVIAEHTRRLVRANFELTLAAKASALGQITSHLIHGLQGPIAGLRSVTTGRPADKGGSDADWRSAADYTERLQLMIQDTVSLLGDIGAPVAYELNGRELADTIRRRNEPAARDRQIHFSVDGAFAERLDSHRGGLLCLIAANLAQNALAATPAGGRVGVTLHVEVGSVILAVADEGGGIAPEAQAHLFEPGRSTRPGGTGLGLAISQLLARQLGGQLSLKSTGPQGTTFQLTMPIAG
jgi:signal transduction histidine kinase